MGDPAEENDPPPESIYVFSDKVDRVNCKIEKSSKIFCYNLHWPMNSALSVVA